VLLVSLREAGVDVDALARRVGIDPAALEQPLAASRAAALLTLASAQVRDPEFGLVAGARLRPELFGVVGFACISAPTFGAALDRIARYRRITSTDRTEIHTEPGGARLVLCQVDHDKPYARQKLEAHFAFIVAFGRYLTGRALAPERVAFRFPAPPHQARYAEVLGCAPAFDASDNEMTFGRATLDLPLVSANPEIFAMFGEKADELLPDEGRSVSERVRAVLRRSLRGELPSVARVARALATSGRSLQRALRAEGTSFQNLLDETRLDLARRHLRNPAIDAAEVAYLLGFTSPSSFYRAFKRWTGLTPEAFRLRA
jgi:AraC-like DNA-binding protein